MDLEIKWPGNKVGPENVVGPGKNNGPWNKVGPGNNFEIPDNSGPCGSIRLVKLISKSPFSHHKRLSG